MVNDHGWQDLRNQRAGFQLPVHAASSGCVLRNSHQTWNERTQGVFDESRSEYRHHLRSTHRAQWFLHLAGPSRATETHPLQRPGNRQNVGVPDQQHVLPALTAALYKSRWQVELFFKWIKQHLRIKRFIGNSENAVKTQIWCAIATYVLIAIVKKGLQIDASL
ncbi:transposase [Nitrosomonas sp.]|uniref:transposase n=1 Tax=Nitrosomonas sp. TaxID=42353 RepID=UPI003521061D